MEFIDTPCTPSDFFMLALHGINTIGQHPKVLGCMQSFQFDIFIFEGLVQSFERQLAMQPRELETIRSEVARFAASIKVGQLQSSNAQLASAGTESERNKINP